MVTYANINRGEMLDALMGEQGCSQALREIMASPKGKKVPIKKLGERAQKRLKELSKIFNFTLSEEGAGYIAERY